MSFLTELKSKLNCYYQSNEKIKWKDNYTYADLVCAYKPSAVLILLRIVNEPAPNDIMPDLEVLIIKRSSSLTHHRSQFAFPGGVQEKTDLELSFTAQRETFEEVGIPPENYYITGAWPPIDVRTGFRIFPFIGLTNSPTPLILDKNEVESAYWINIKEFIFNKQMYSRLVSVNGTERQAWYYPTQYGLIWGATGTILHDFLTFLTEQFAIAE